MTMLEPKAHSKYFQSSATPQFLLRMGGLPINVMDNLLFEQTSEWIKTLLSIEQLLAEYKAPLVDALHEAVNANKEQTSMRRKLINLKRDVFNLRPLMQVASVRSIASTLSTPASTWLEKWADLWEHYNDVYAQGADMFQQEVRQKRALLKQVIEDEDFRKGILLSSPVLDQAVNMYLASDNSQLNRSARTAERSLVEYLLRTACKTSPFSTFTTVSSGTFKADAAADSQALHYEIQATHKKSFIRLNMAVLSKISSLILTSETIRKTLPVQFTPGYHIQDNRIRYLRRMQSMDDIDEEAPIALDIIHENIFYLPVGKLLTSLITCVGKRKMRYEEIIAALCSLPAYKNAEQEVDMYVQHLLRLGLLIIPDLQLNIHTTFPLSNYCRGLRAIETPVTDRLAELLGSIEEMINAYTTASLSERRDIASQIKLHVRKCYAELGQEEAHIPRTLVYEDTTVHFDYLHINETAWQDILQSTAELQSILPVFDVNLPRKLVTKGYFQARYGVGQRCDDFMSFAYEFRLGFFEHYLQAAGMRVTGEDEGQTTRSINYFQQPEFDMLDTARQTARDYMQIAYDHLLPTSKELALDENFISNLLPYIPENRGSVSSHTFFSQFANVDGAPRVVLNRTYTGLTLMYSRFAHFLDAEEGHQLVAGLRAHLNRQQPPNAVFAELKGGYDATNLNLHPQVTAYELVCPGDMSTRPEEEQIPLDDLYIQDDEQAGYLRLYSKRLGKEVIPLYLGFLMPMALPEIQQVLLNFSYATMCPMDLWEGVQRKDTETSITYYPRLRYKSLILQRAHWKVRPEAFPRRESGQADQDFFLKVARWRKQHNVPQNVFVAPEISKGAFVPRAVEREADQKTQSYKPLFIDFENYFSLMLLEAMSRDSSTRLVFTEMLPNREQLWLEHDGQSYVSEFVWEMNTFEGDHHDKKLG